MANAILELSPAAYDEIERKLLDAGYSHVFEQGPGSAIDMNGFAVERENAKPMGKETAGTRRAFGTGRNRGTEERWRC